MAWPVFLLLSFGLVAAIRAMVVMDIERPPQPNHLNRWSFIFIAGVSAVWTILAWSGSGFNPDQNHNISLLSDLIDFPWPLSFVTPLEGVVKPFVGDIGYFLPAAFVGKLSGWTSAQVVFVFYTFFGIFLALVWFSKILARFPKVASIVFIFLGGMDILGQILLLQNFPSGTSIVEGWTGVWYYLSNSTLLFSIPQCGLPGWIVTGMLMWEILHEKEIQGGVLAVVLVSLWSPLVAIGLLPFLLIAGIKRKLKLASLETVGATLLCVLPFLYYSSAPDSLPHGWIHPVLNLYWTWPRLIWFYLFEFALIAVTLRPSLIREKGLKTIAIAATVVLLILPFYLYSDARDVTMKVSIPSLFAFWTLVSLNLFEQPRDLNWRFLLLFCFFGAFSSIGLFSQAISNVRQGLPYLSETQVISNRMQWFERYILGDVNSPFFRFFSKKINPDKIQHVRWTEMGPSKDIFIEAEHYENQTRINHVQECPVAHNNKIVNRDFGSSPKDELEYTFSTGKNIAVGILSVYYATMINQARLSIFLDGNRIGDLSCDNTGGWWNFSRAEFLLRSLPAGTHRLVVKSNGGNVNLDVFAIKILESYVAAIEGEEYENKPKDTHVQACRVAMGGYIVDREFGALPNDFLRYSFDLPRQLYNGMLAISYATMDEGALYDIFIDETKVATVPLRNTHGWWKFTEKYVLLPRIESGPHVLTVRSNGVRVNFDTFWFIKRP